MRLSWLLSLVFVLGLGDRAFAGPTITSVSGASAFNLTGAVTIFGGLAGERTSCTAGDTYSTCNSCTAGGVASCPTTPLCPCNQARIYDGLIMTIFTSNVTKDANGNQTTTNGNVIVTQQNSTTPISSLNPNNGGTSVQFNWSTICAQVSNGGGTDCETLGQTIPNASVTLNFYIDANNDGQVTSGETATSVTFRILTPSATYATFSSTSSDGIGTFEPYPGDGKSYIKDPQTSTSFPSLGYGGSVKNVRVFYATTSLTDATPLSSTSADLAVSDDGSSLSKNIVDGLSNGTLYFLRVGMVDEASNVVQMSPDPAADADAADASCSTSPSASCKYSATPDEVLGLLSNDFNCFVATAAYGSMLEPKLAVFREFRARFLLRNGPGRTFTSWYYAYGPYAARFIGERPWARVITRGLLWPAYGFGWVALRYGLSWALGALAFTLVALGWGARLTWSRGMGARD